MSEQLLERLNANLEALIGGGAASGAGGGGGPTITFGETPGGGFSVPANLGGFGGPAPAASMMPAGAMAAGGGNSNVAAVLVPVTVQTPEGDCTVHLSFDGSWGQSMPALFNLLQQLAYAGVPLKIWKPKRRDDWGGGSWGGNGRGGYGSRGGYGGGYGGRRRGGWRD